MKFVPDVDALKKMLVVAIEENKSLLEKCLPLYREEKQKAEEQVRKSKEAYRAAREAYDIELKRWEENKSWCKGPAPVYKGPARPSFDEMNVFNCKFSGIVSSLKTAINDAEKLLYSLKFISAITELDGNDMQRIHNCTNYLGYQEWFEKELDKKEV